MTNRAKIKGDKFENDLVKLHIKSAIKCNRTLLAVQAGKHHLYDLTIDVDGFIFRGEAKFYKTGSGFKSLYKYSSKDILTAITSSSGCKYCIMGFDEYINVIKRNIPDNGYNIQAIESPIKMTIIDGWLKKSDVLFCKMNRCGIVVVFSEIINNFIEVT